jgi:hypothetical protein
MSESYEEIVRGETYLRPPPDARHEVICARLHEHVARSVAGLSSARLLPARSIVQVVVGTMLRPDLALVTVATGKLWLAAEIISSLDHRLDTVTKKTFYEEVNLPRLWMIDTRYDNAEVYHASEYGLALKGILASRDILRESLLPGFQIPVNELFAS